MCYRYFVKFDKTIFLKSKLNITSIYDFSMKVI